MTTAAARSEAPPIAADVARGAAGAVDVTCTALLDAVLHAAVMSSPPHLRARSRGDGRRAAVVVDHAIAPMSSFGPTAELLLSHGLRPGFVARAAETVVAAAARTANSTISRSGRSSRASECCSFRRCSGPSPGA